MKIAEDLGEENLTAEQKYIVDQIKASKQQGEIVKGVGAGLWDFTVDTVMGLWYLKNHPLEVGYQTAVALMNPVETYTQIRDAIVNSYVQEMVNGNSYTRARWITYAAATIATSIVGTKGADKFGKIAWTAGKSNLKDVAGKTTAEIKEFGNDLRYQPQDFQPVAAGGGGLNVDVDMPVNVINTGKLYDEIETQRESYLFYKGKDKTIEPNDVVPYRPSNSPLENHHGVMDVWAKHNVPNYVSRGANTPTLALTKEQHNATKAVYRQWLFEKTGKKVGGKVDWKSVSPREIQELTEKMFDAANIPDSAKQEYYKAFNQYNFRE